MNMLKPGDSAPAFSLTDQSGKTVHLSDFRGRHLLIYFYPKADTPGCTKQACSVRDANSDLFASGIDAVGVSPDVPGDQRKFDVKYNLGFPLLSDPDHRVAEKYGVWGEKAMYGKSYMGIIRSAFLVDDNGQIKAAWYKVAPADTVLRVKSELGLD